MTPLVVFPPSSDVTADCGLATAHGEEGSAPAVSGTCKHRRAAKVCHPAGHRQELVSSRRSPWTLNTDRNAGG